MDQELAKAAKVIEEAGGFVMFPENSQEERDIRKQTHNLELQKEAEEKAEIEENENDFEKRKKEAFKEMNREFYRTKGPMLTTMSDLEDILLDNGVDMDYLEEWIESQV
jgi:hypothetical protein